MKVKITFNLEEDMQEFKAVSHLTEILDVLFELRYNFGKKMEMLEDQDNLTSDQIRVEIYDLLREIPETITQGL